MTKPAVKHVIVTQAGLAPNTPAKLLLSFPSFPLLLINYPPPSFHHFSSRISSFHRAHRQQHSHGLPVLCKSVPWFFPPWISRQYALGCTSYSYSGQGALPWTHSLGCIPAVGASFLVSESARVVVKRSHKISGLTLNLHRSFCTVHCSRSNAALTSPWVRTETIRARAAIKDTLPEVSILRGTPNHLSTMSSAVAELENYLQSMLALKPPGVSGSKIQGITTLCTANVQVCFTFRFTSNIQDFKTSKLMNVTE